MTYTDPLFFIPVAFGIVTLVVYAFVVLTIMQNWKNFRSPFFLLFLAMFPVVSLKVWLHIVKKCFKFDLGAEPISLFYRYGKCRKVGQISTYISQITILTNQRWVSSESIKKFLICCLEHCWVSHEHISSSCRIYVLRLRSVLVFLWKSFSTWRVRTGLDVTRSCNSISLHFCYEL